MMSVCGFTRVPISLILMAFIMLFAGATIGANQAAMDEPAVDLVERLHEDSFTEDGEIVQREPPEGSPGVEFEFGERVADATPDTPKLDRWVRQNIVKPVLIAAFWVAGLGNRLGYVMVSTLGVNLTRVVFNGSVVFMLAGTMVHFYKLMRRAGR